MNRQKAILRDMTLVFVFSASVLFAQEPKFQREVDTIPVIINGVPVSNPFAGGASYSKATFIDIDNDNDFDLLVGAYDGNLNFYRNDGTTANPAFTFVTENFASIDIGLYSTPAFADIDNDGDFDLFVGEDAGNINFYRNTGTAANPAFTLVTDNFASIDVGSRSTPAFADIDNDGDFDLLMGEEDGNLNFYRNDGTATNPMFILVIENFVSIDVGFESAPSFADIDKDGDFDLLVGEDGGNLNFYRNTGTASNPAYTVVIENFASIDVGFYSAPSFIDIDNDGDVDLFVGENDSNLNFYRNTSTIGTPDFTVVTENFSAILDIGFFSTPTFADVDNDNDFDLLVGEFAGNLNFYRNTGTASNPAFTVVMENFGSIVVGGDHSALSFADIDKDGDSDLFVGVLGGNLNFYRNDGTVANPTFTLITRNFASIDVGGFSTPSFADIDNDGDFDLFVGEFDGNLNFYRNTGTATNPVFTLETANFASIAVGRYSNPNFTDIDNDGDFDLFVGEFDGNLNFYRNTGTIANPAFTFVTSNFASIAVGSFSTPSFADIDNDGDFDLFVGEYDGGLHFYRNVTPSTNRTPVVANTISNQTLTVGGAAFTRNLNASPAVFNDPDGDALTYTASSSATNIATASISGTTLTVAPVAAGNSTITVTANDGKGGTRSTTFTVTVGAAANRPPMVANAISNQTLTVGGAAFTRNLNASPTVFNDPDGDALTYTASSSATNIAMASISDSTLTVAPVAAGNATITVTANDGKGGTRSTTFTVTVGAAANRPPMVANAISNQTLTVGGASFTRDLNASPTVFTDPDGDALAYTVTTSALNNATANISGNTLTVAPVSGGVATITITANDGKGGMTSTNFLVTVNRPPTVANLIPNQALTVGDASFTRILNASPAVFTDPDGDPLGYTTSSNASSIATASISASTLTVAPVAVGNVTITVTANDNRGGTVSTTFTVTVGTAANRSPVVANAISPTTIIVGGAPFTRDLNAAPVVFTDPDGDALTYTASSSVTNVATAGIAGSTLTVSAVAAGSATITVTANDGKGGVVPATFGVTVNSSSGDQSAPQITHSGVTTAISGQSQPIAAAITDNVGVQSVMLFYRVGGAAAYDSAAMQNTGSNNYERAIPAGFVGERGVEYYFSAYDGAKNKSTFPTTNPQTNPQVIQVISGKLTFPRATPARAYRMISVPIELNDKSPSSVLAVLGRYDDTQWRLLRYSNGTNIEFGSPGFANFEPATGFWLITRESKSLDAGTGKSVTTAQNYVIALPPGWSQIGNPFAFTVNWSDVSKSANVENRLVGYQGTLNEPTGYDYTRTQLMPFEGYFVNNRSSNPTTIAIPPKAASSNGLAKTAANLLAQEIFVGGEWGMQITAACERYLDKDNYIGCRNDAADEWDPNDFSEAPFFDQNISLYFPHPEWATFPGLYTGDFRAVKPEGEAWDFFVKSEVKSSEGAKSEVKLKLADIKNLPVDWKVVLLDKTGRLAVDFRARGEYTFLASANETKRDFRIIVGPPDFVQHNDLGLAAVPDDFVLEPNFPNPFLASGKPSTTPKPRSVSACRKRAS